MERESGVGEVEEGTEVEWSDFFPLDGPRLSACLSCGAVVLTSRRKMHLAVYHS